MLKRLFLVAYFSVIAFMVVSWVISKFRKAPPDDTVVSSGSLSDLPRHLAALRGSENPKAFLIVALADTEDFIQMQWSKDAFWLDYPLVKDLQGKREPLVREVLADHRITVVDETLSTNASPLAINAWVYDEATMLRLVHDVLFRAFGASGDPSIDYTAFGLRYETA